MKNELQRMFVYFISGVVLLVALYAAFGPKGKKINLKEIEFRTSSSSELYFKNIRSYFYDKEERQDARFTLHRIGNRNKENDKLHFVIVSNWLLDESYVLAETEGEFPVINWEYEEKKGGIVLQGANNRAHFIFAAEVFEQLDREAKLSIVLSNSIYHFTNEEMASLRTSLKDYFKLVGKVR